MYIYMYVCARIVINVRMCMYYMLCTYEYMYVCMYVCF